MPDSPLYEVEDTEPMKPITDDDIRAFELSRAIVHNTRMRQLLRAIASKNYLQLRHIFLQHGGSSDWYNQHNKEDKVAIVAETLLQWLQFQE